MAAGRQPSRRCANRGEAMMHRLARTFEWPLQPPPVRLKMGRAIIGPASSSTTREIAKGSNRGMIRIIPIGPLLPITTPASRRAMYRIIPTGRLLLAIRDNRSPMCEIIRTGLPITPGSRRAMSRIIRTGRLLLAIRDNRSPMCEIIRTGPRLPITPASPEATSRTIRIVHRPPTVVVSRPRAISRGIHPETTAETGPIRTVRLVRGRITQTLRRYL
jgi:hypothetical protein